MSLYMLPGVLHCRGGPGADTFDRMAAITAWVERGEKPPHRAVMLIHGDVATASITVNSIPKVLHAPPGLHTMRSLALPSFFPGR